MTLWLWRIAVLLVSVGFYLALNHVIPLCLGRVSLWWLPIWLVSMAIIAHVADSLESELSHA